MYLAILQVALISSVRLVHACTRIYIHILYIYYIYTDMFFRFRLCHSKGGNGWNRAGPPFLGGMDGRFRGRGRINGKLYSIRCEGEFYRMGIR